MVTKGHAGETEQRSLVDFNGGRGNHDLYGRQDRTGDSLTLESNHDKRRCDSGEHVRLGNKQEER